MYKFTKYDILCISETWCSIRDEINYIFESHKCYRNDRTVMKRGGTAVYIKKYLQPYVKTVVLLFIDIIFIILIKVY